MATPLVDFHHRLTACPSYRKKLPDDVIRELDDNREFWETHETRASEVQDRVNDAYLKSNGLKDGVQSYGQLTTLMLMWYTESNV